MTDEKEKSPVGIPSIGYDIMSEKWPLIHDLLGGTAAMRAAATTWLPQEEAEGSSGYDSRLGRSVLFNGFRDTTQKLANRPFSHPVVITDLPEQLEYLQDDVDSTGKPLDTFSKEVLDAMIKYGLVHILVDHSVVETVVDGGETTKADEAEVGARVFLSCIKPPNLIGWQSEKNPSSKVLELTQIRIKETVTETDGDYGDAESVYINVINNDTWETHQQDSENEDKYVKIDEGTHTFKRIYLITIYANKIGFLMAEPPLMDLAWLNLAHWQSDSDQRNILRLSRFGLLFGAGLDKELVQSGSLDVGPSKAILCQNADAKLTYVEHTGKAIEAGRKDLQDIEEKMEIVGQQPMMRTQPQTTATAKRVDETRKFELSESFAINIYSDFEAVLLGASDKELLLKMRQVGELSMETHLREQQRRGTLSTDVDIEEEVEAIGADSKNELENFITPEDDDVDFDEEDE